MCLVYAACRVQLLNLSSVYTSVWYGQRKPRLSLPRKASVLRLQSSSIDCPFSLHNCIGVRYEKTMRAWNQVYQESICSIYTACRVQVLISLSTDTSVQPVMNLHMVSWFYSSWKRKCFDWLAWMHKLIWVLENEQRVSSDCADVQ